MLNSESLYASTGINWGAGYIPPKVSALMRSLHVNLHEPETF